MASPPEGRPWPPPSALASQYPRVPAAAHLAPAGARAEGPGGLCSPGLRAALCSEVLAPPVAGVSATGRGLRAQFPGAEPGATAARGGFLRCCPSRSPSSSLDPPGLSTRCPFGPPSLRRVGSALCQMRSHVCCGVLRAVFKPGSANFSANLMCVATLGKEVVVCWGSSGKKDCPLVLLKSVIKKHS